MKKEQYPIEKKFQANRLKWGLFTKYNLTKVYDDKETAWKHIQVFFNGLGSYIKNHFQDVFIYLGRVRFTLKNGYSPQATWETDYWFVCSMYSIISEYKRYGHFDDTSEDYKAFERAIDEMLDCLLFMQQHDHVGTEEECRDYKNAKDKFFELFNKYFNWFWD